MSDSTFDAFDTCDAANQLALQSYSNVINQIIKDYPILSKGERESLEGSKYSLEAVLNGEDPSNIYNYIAIGSYKACFHLSPHFVIKFGRNDEDDDELEKERMTYDAALNSDVQDYFIPSYFIPMPDCRIRSTIMFEEEMWNYSYAENADEMLEEECDSRAFNYVIIQPKIDFLDYEYLPFCSVLPDMDLTNEACLHFLDGMPEEAKNAKYLVSTGFLALEQVRDFLFAYGLDVQKAFIKFVKEYDIHDLHIANTGKLNGRPVIIDWLSN